MAKSAKNAVAADLSDNNSSGSENSVRQEGEIPVSKSLNQTLAALESENNRMIEEIQLQRAIHVNDKLKKKLAGLKIKAPTPKTSPENLLASMKKDKKLSKKAKKLQKSLLKFESDSASSSSSSSSSEDESSSESPDVKSKHSKYKKLKHKKQKRDKSGITRKASDKAVFDVAWPQEFCGNGDLSFDELSLTALVRGETFIINNIEPVKFAKLRGNHLMQLMYFAEQFTFNNVLKFHHDVLKDIESGRATWDSNFDNIRARRLVDHVPRQYCANYNRSVCKKKEGHFNCYGITEEHICSNCWLKRKNVSYHPQKDCRVSGNYPRRNDKEAKDTTVSHSGNQHPQPSL